MYMMPMTPEMVPQYVAGAYPAGAVPMVPQMFVYTPQPMLALQPMMPPMQAAAPMYTVPPSRPHKNKGNAVLFVGQLNYDVTEKDVRELFAYYGNVVNVVLLKDSKRSGLKGEEAATKGTRSVIGSSAFVTYATTAEADLSIMSLHNRYCMDSRDRPVQVSYCQKTDIISDFGYRHALQLHEENPANPIPSVTPAPTLACGIRYA